MMAALRYEAVTSKSAGLRCMGAKIQFSTSVLSFCFQYSDILGHTKISINKLIYITMLVPSILKSVLQKCSLMSVFGLK